MKKTGKRFISAFILSFFVLAISPSVFASPKPVNGNLPPPKTETAKKPGEKKEPPREPARAPEPPRERDRPPEDEGHLRPRKRPLPPPREPAPMRTNYLEGYVSVVVSGNRQKVLVETPGGKFYTLLFISGSEMPLYDSEGNPLPEKKGFFPTKENLIRRKGQYVNLAGIKNKENRTFIVSAIID